MRNLLRPLIAVLMCCSLVAAEGADTAAGDILEIDQWYAGYFDKQPTMTVHVVRRRHADGSATLKTDQAVVITRKLGARSLRMEMHMAQTIEQDADGNLVSFMFDEDQDNKRTTIEGRIEGSEAVAQIHRLGRITEQRVKLPQSPPLVSDQEFERMIAAAGQKPGDKLVVGQLVPLSGRLVFATATATMKEVTAEGNIVFDMITDVVPVPMTMTVNRKGDLLEMSMNLMIFAVSVTPSDGPVPLLGAEMAMNGLVSAKGIPKSRESNRYRLPAGSASNFQADPFQTIDGDVITIASQAPLEELQDPKQFLKEEPQLELDDPALREWVEAIRKNGSKNEAELAEQLRLAVRSHITTGDFSKNDASALETFRDRRGDCTEHANLLCAALRIAGIPARTETGFVFAADYGDWVGHAWNSAYLDGRWVHLDSAYPGIERSKYLKIATTSGDEPLSTAGAMITSTTKLAGKAIETLE
jgi:hypothetical protein